MGLFAQFKEDKFLWEFTLSVHSSCSLAWKIITIVEKCKYRYLYWKNNTRKIFGFSVSLGAQKM